MGGLLFLLSRQLFLPTASSFLHREQRKFIRTRVPRTVLEEKACSYEHGGAGGRQVTVKGQRRAWKCFFVSVFSSSYSTLPPPPQNRNGNWRFGGIFGDFGPTGWPASAPRDSESGLPLEID